MRKVHEATVCDLVKGDHVPRNFKDGQSCLVVTQRTFRRKDNKEKTQVGGEMELWEVNVDAKFDRQGRKGSLDRGESPAILIVLVRRRLFVGDRLGASELVDSAAVHG